MSARAASKPLDVGSGRVVASFDANSAAWLSIGTPHPVHGFVELSALPPFDEHSRGNPEATRRHRLAMTSADHAFVRFEVDGSTPLLSPDPSDPLRPRWRAPGIEVVADAPREGDRVRQTWRLSGVSELVLHVRGKLDRPALAEITEVNPPSPTGATTTRRISGAKATFDAPALPARAEIVLGGAAATWAPDGAELIAIVPPVARDGELTLTIEVALGAARGEPWRVEVDGAHHDTLTQRALAYVRGCTALRVTEHERTILTDHRILPLSWTRDAYWQALALLAADGAGDRERVADHLRWLWRRCERPDGRWVRSHAADGRRKDLAFQADQQLYPILELADYWRRSGELPAGMDWTAAVNTAWAAALAERDPFTGLMASAENAADDPVAAPYLATAQILLWYTAARLAELARSGAVALDVNALRGVAASVSGGFATWFATCGDAWPYAVDRRTIGPAYHDANDLPLALAAMWGFCDPDDPGWRATVAFAFSDRNPGFFVGERSGLGSAHTPGPWTLGDVQAWIVARTLDDDASAADALARLRAVAFEDGMLPEAYSSAADPDIRVRHWFAWPGAALAALRTLDASGSLPSRLAAERIA